jgi:hypothetical protein
MSLQGCCISLGVDKPPACLQRDICILAILRIGFHSFANMEIGFTLLPFSNKGTPLQCFV